MKNKIFSALLVVVMVIFTFAFTSCDMEILNSSQDETGEQGFQGEQGEPGKDGQDGRDGKDGVGISSTEVNADGELVLYFTNGTSINLGRVVGSDGKDGVDGIDGAPGITPKIRINSETTEWEVSYDNGETWNGLGCFADTNKDTSFDGLKISILGDSISTYTNASSGTASAITNSTIKNGAVYYNPGQLGVYQGDTWWQQTADTLGGSVLVNNSWSGSCVFSTRSGTVGAYIDRCVQLHDDTGLNAGEEPDLIFVYLGTNDCSVWSSYPLGSYDSINFSTLIQKNKNGYIYAEPKTASEAYAIMIHKMTRRYEDAEIYCMIPCQRIDGNATAIANRLTFYDAIEKIAARFGAYTIDLYNDSGITTDSDSFTTFIPDNSLHPGQEGMDAITNTVLSTLYENSKYAPKDKNVFRVSYKTDAVISEGRKYATLEDESFSCTVKEKNGYELDISVFMNGEEITEAVIQGNKIFIEKVTGNLTIEADYIKITRDPLSFRFETVGDKLVSIITDGNTENIVTQNQGTIVDGFYTNAQFSLGTTIELLHDRAWAIEWKVKGSPSMLLLSGAKTSMGNKNGNSYIFIHSSTAMVTLGEYIGPTFDNYSAVYDKSYLKEYHIYRLENRIDENGNNMVYLLIDGNEIGALDDYYKDASNQNKTSNWVLGKDFFFSYIGTISGQSHSHPISNCYLEYLQIWEEI